MLSANNIIRFTAHLTEAEFIIDPITVRAVAFELIIIGEAVRVIPDEIRRKNPHIHWNEIQGIRNLLVHEYFRIDETILWETIQHDIPLLINDLTQIRK